MPTEKKRLCNLYCNAVADPKIFQRGGGRQFINLVLIYRKRAQRSIGLLHGKKSGFLKKYEPIGPPLNPPLLQHKVKQERTEKRKDRRKRLKWHLQIRSFLICRAPASTRVLLE